MWVDCYECQQHLKIQPKTSVAHRTWMTPKSKMCIASLCNDIQWAFTEYMRNVYGTTMSDSRQIFSDLFPFCAAMVKMQSKRNARICCLQSARVYVKLPNIIHHVCKQWALLYSESHSTNFQMMWFMNFSNSNLLQFCDD